MKLYVVRHGQTNLNLEHKLQGKIGLPLNEKGIEQAKELGSELKNIVFSKAYSSPQERAIQTVSIASGIDKKDIILDERLEPCGMGEADNMVIDENLKFEFGLLPDRKIYKGVENPEEFKARIKDFLDEIIAENKGKDINIIIGGHKCTTGCIDGLLNKWPDDNNFFAISTKNGKYKVYNI